MAQSTCTTSGCSRPVYIKSRGLCRRCYSIRPDGPICSTGGCGRRGQLRRGLCDRCRQRVRVYGDPTVTRNRVAGTQLAELTAAAHASTDDCIILSGRWPGGRPHVLVRGRTMLAARAVWTLANGDPGDGFVLHSCNGGSGADGCINVRHLYLGDHARNMQDMAEAGRASDQRGTRNGNARLTPDDVREVRRRYVRGRGPYDPGNGRDLAAEFGIGRTTLSEVVRRVRWPHLD